MSPAGRGTPGSCQRERRSAHLYLGLRSRGCTVTVACGLTIASALVVVSACVCPGRLARSWPCCRYEPGTLYAGLGVWSMLRRLAAARRTLMTASAVASVYPGFCPVSRLRSATTCEIHAVGLVVEHSARVLQRGIQLPIHSQQSLLVLYFLLVGVAVQPVAVLQPLPFSSFRRLQQHRLSLSQRRDRRFLAMQRDQQPADIWVFAGPPWDRVRPSRTPRLTLPSPHLSASSVPPIAGSPGWPVALRVAPRPVARCRPAERRSLPISSRQAVFIYLRPSRPRAAGPAANPASRPR